MAPPIPPIETRTILPIGTSLPPILEKAPEALTIPPDRYQNDDQIKIYRESSTAKPDLKTQLMSLKVEKTLLEILDHVRDAKINIKIPLRPGKYDTDIQNGFIKMGYDISKGYATLRVEIENRRIKSVRLDFNGNLKLRMDDFVIPGLEEILKSLTGNVPVGEISLQAQEYESFGRLALDLGIHIDLTDTVQRVLGLKGEKRGLPLDLMTLVQSVLKKFRDKTDPLKVEQKSQGFDNNIFILEKSFVQDLSVKLRPGRISFGSYSVKIGRGKNDRGNVFQIRNSRLEEIFIGPWYLEEVRDYKTGAYLRALEGSPLKINLKDKVLYFQFLNTGSDVLGFSELQFPPGQMHLNSQVGGVKIKNVKGNFHLERGDFSLALSGLRGLGLNVKIAEHELDTVRFYLGQVNLSKTGRGISSKLKDFFLDLYSGKVQQGEYGLEWSKSSVPHRIALPAAQFSYQNDQVYFEISKNEQGQSLGLDFQAFNILVPGKHFVHFGQVQLRDFILQCAFNPSVGNSSLNLNFSGFIPKLEFVEASVGQGSEKFQLLIGKSSASFLGLSFAQDELRVKAPLGHVDFNINNLWVALGNTGIKLPLMTDLLFSQSSVRGRIDEVLVQGLLKQEEPVLHLQGDLNWQGSANGKISSEEAINQFVFEVEDLVTQANLKELVLRNWQFRMGLFGKAHFKTEKLLGSLSGLGGPQISLDQGSRITAGWTESLLIDLRKSLMSSEALMPHLIKDLPALSGKVMLGEAKGMYADVLAQARDVMIHLNPYSHKSETGDGDRHLKASSIHLSAEQEGNRIIFAWDPLIKKVYMAFLGGDMHFRIKSKGTEVD